jgi:anti-sigma factor RsiW
MNSIEEILWNYIDGNCSQAEQTIIAARIAEDEAYRLKYQELLKLNQDFSEMELDEPSMAFTYNVMEDIRAENARAPLKAAINKRIIWGIALFFVITLLAVLFFILTSINWSAQSAPVNLAVNFKMPDINPVKTKIVLQSFVFFDVILALYLLDSYLRKKNIAKQV